MIGCRHIAPADGDGRPRPPAEIETAPIRRPLRDDLAVAPHAHGIAHAFHARFRRAARHLLEPADGERQLGCITVRKGGKVYVYYRHRKSGQLIKSDPGSAAFVREVAAIEDRMKRSEPRDGSLEALIKDYRASPEFTKLATRTKSDYIRVFEWIQPVADIGANELDSGSIYAFRDDALERRGRRFANYVVQVLRLTLDWGRKRNKVEKNVAAGIELLERPKHMPKANRAWSDAERETVLSEAPLELLKVIAIGMFAGLREGDAIRLLKEDCDGKIIRFVTRKTGQAVEIPAHYRLREILARTAEPPKRARKLEHLARTIAVNRWGRSWTESGFRASFFKMIGRLEREGKVGSGLTFHGLRHTVGKLVIEAGGSIQDVAAILGQKSEAMAKHYSKEADNRRRVQGVVRKLERIERRKLDKTSD